jgi:hypothetical protein
MRKLFVIALFFCALSGIFPQEDYGTGAILDEEQYESLPQKAPQLSRAYTALPSSVSLKNYAPIPGHQGKYSSCTAWAAAYAARTIAESIALNRTNKKLIANSVFSPAFVYKSISKDPACKTGVRISDALELMRNVGAPKMTAAERVKDFLEINPSLYINEKKYTIDSYATLYTRKTDPNTDSRAYIVKKCLSERKPVIIVIICPPSFKSIKKKDVWSPTEKPDPSIGGHALCVVGYDDKKYGGAFEIQNSWGAGWGNEGYCWIPYKTFNLFASQAYELVDNLATYGKLSEYSGEIQIELSNSFDNMPVTFQNGYYQTIHEYPSGTRFRYLLGNDKPAYVYAFGADDSTIKTTMIFPYEGQSISPVLDYSENFIAFPSESAWIELDEITGTDYLTVLYSKEAIDIGAVRKRFESARGSFPERVAQAVGNNFIPYNRAKYEAKEIKFSAQSLNNKAVFGLLLAIKHR